MNNLNNTLWIETRKALKSTIPWLTALGFMILPLMSGFLFFLYKNPDLSQKLGLIGAKANLVVGEVSWLSYLKIVKEAFSIGGIFIICLMLSWIFGREFTDHTAKDLLAVPIPRWNLLLAKFAVVVLWYAFVVIVAGLFSLGMGMLIHLPGGSANVILQECIHLLITALLTLLVMLPSAFFASFGRGVFLPLGIAIITIILANLAYVIGYGDYFPWSIPGNYAQGSPLAVVSIWIVLFTALAGILATYFWWMYADQSK